VAPGSRGKLAKQAELTMRDHMAEKQRQYDIFSKAVEPAYTAFANFSASAGEKYGGWEVGKVLDSQRAELECCIAQEFLIQGGTQVYSAQQILRWRWSKPANLTVNGPVKFAVKKANCYWWTRTASCTKWK